MGRRSWSLQNVSCSRATPDVRNIFVIFRQFSLSTSLRSRSGKPNQCQNEKFMNFAHFCEFWCFSLGKQAQFTLTFCSGMPLRKVHELTFLWFGLPGPLLIKTLDVVSGGVCGAFVCSRALLLQTFSLFKSVLVSRWISLHHFRADVAARA